MSTSKSEYSTRVIALLPIMTIMVLMYGAAKQFVYYYSFNLDIFSFLDITELLPQTLFDLFISAFYIIIAFLVAMLYSYFVHKEVGLKKNESKSLKEKIFLPDEVLNERVNHLKQEMKKLNKRMRTSISVIVIFTFFLLFIHITLLFICFNGLMDQSGNQKLTPFWIGAYKFIFNLTLVSLSTIIISVPFTIIKSLKDKTLQVIISMTLFLALAGFFDGRMKFLSVFNKHTHDNYYIVINKEKKISNNAYYYIGKTKSNVFYYNVKTNLATAFPISLNNRNGYWS